ncbi:hypothetical protein [Sporolactobacillus shoreae]|nr:hypothetical protein [Sporolactobacillus shoreae]
MEKETKVIRPEIISHESIQFHTDVLAPDHFSNPSGYHHKD